MEELKIKRFLINKDTREAIELIGEKVFGRKKTCDVPINDELISGNHMKIVNEVSRAYLVDLNSYNKTRVNGLVVEPNIEIELKENDEIRIGGQVYVFSDSNRLAQDQIFGDDDIHVVTLLDYNEPPEWGDDPEIDFRYQQLEQKKQEVQTIIDRIKKIEDDAEQVSEAKQKLKDLDKEIVMMTEIFPVESLPEWRKKRDEFKVICQELEKLQLRKEELEGKVRQFLRYEELAKKQIRYKEVVKGHKSNDNIDQKIGELKFMLGQEQEVLKNLQESYEREKRKSELSRKERKKKEFQKHELERQIEELQSKLKKIK